GSFIFGHRIITLTSPTAITSDLRTLTQPDEILAAIRNAARFSRGAEKPASTGLNFNDGPSDYGNTVVVPIDSRLEAIGRNWASSPDLAERLRAISALSHFKTPANIATLQGMLSDRGMLWPMGN